MARFVWKYVWVSGAGAHEKMSVKRVRWLQDTKGVSGSTTAAMKWALLGDSGGRSWHWKAPATDSSPTCKTICHVQACENVARIRSDSRDA